MQTLQIPHAFAVINSGRRFANDPRKHGIHSRAPFYGRGFVAAASSRRFREQDAPDTTLAVRSFEKKLEPSTYLI